MLPPASETIVLSGDTNESFRQTNKLVTEVISFTSVDAAFALDFMRSTTDCIVFVRETMQSATEPIFSVFHGNKSVTEAILSAVERIASVTEHIASIPNRMQSGADDTLLAAKMMS